MDSASRKQDWRVPALLLLLAVFVISGRTEWSLPGVKTAKLVRWCLFIGAATAGIIALQLSWKPLVTSSAAAKRIFIFGIPLSAAIMIFLLAPFQGPDEVQHWKLALNFSRADATHETPAFSLPEILQVGPIPFNPQVKFDAQQLRTEQLVDYPQLPTDYIYVRPYSYAPVSAVALLFPRVHSVHEGLIFYYLSRIAPLLALMALLLYAHRKFELPCTAICFFTLPLVLQQSTIVTADTLLNLGAIVAVLLFIYVRRTKSNLAYASLWVLCLLLAYGKIICAGILFLPLALLPFEKIPLKKIVIPLALLFVAILGYVAVLKVIAGMRQTPLIGRTLEERVATCNIQLESLTTLHGWAVFARAYETILIRSIDIRQFSSPLGWLDTELNPFHKALIILSGAAVVFFDMIQYLPSLKPVLRDKRRDLLLCVALIAGNFLFLSLSDSLIYYCIGTVPGSTNIMSLQMRHLFPGIIVALLLPLMLTDRAPQPETGGSLSVKRISLYSLMLVSLVVLLFARNAELAFDLLIRYW
jgi:hypothetical protein